jgi:hypothetical protein
VSRAPVPLRQVLQVLLLLWQVVASFVRDLMVEEFEDGRIRTRGLPAGVRVAVILAIVGVGALLVSIAVADRWRSALEPVAMPGGQALRGTLVPDALIPVTFALLAIGVALCLSGALRAASPVAAGVLLVYLVLAGFLRVTSELGDGLVHRAAGWAVWGVVAIFLVARFVRPRPNLELFLLICLVGATFADAHSVFVAADHTSGTGFLAAQTQILLADIVQLSIPVLVVAALDVVDFGVHAARWGLGFVDRRLGQQVTVVALVALGAWRSRDLVLEFVHGFADGDGADLSRAVLGSAVLLAAIAGALVLIDRSSRRSTAGVARTLTPGDPEAITNETRRVALPIALGLLVVMLTSAVLFLAMQAVPVVLDTAQTNSVHRWGIRAIEVLGDIGGNAWWDPARAAALAAGAVLMTRRGRPLAAAFLASMAVVFLHGFLTYDDRVLADWGWSLAGVDLLVTAAVGFLVVRWALRRQLSAGRAQWAFFLLLLTALLRQSDFISDPFSPLLALSAVGFVLFGLAWGFATNGAWANEGSPHLPRLSRVQLLIGYQLLSAAILHWFVVTHDVAQIEVLATDMPDVGLAWLGQPLMLALLLTGIAAAARDVPLVIGDLEPASDPDEPGLERGGAGR